MNPNYTDGMHRSVINDDMFHVDAEEIKQPNMPSDSSAKPS